MSTLEQIEQLMKELGPVLDPLGIQSFADEQCWLILLDEDIGVLLEYVEQERRLVLNCDLGEPAQGDRTALYEMLLGYNALWDQTGGARMALIGEPKRVQLIFDLVAVDLDVSRLSNVVSSFGAIAYGWRRVVQSPATEQNLGGSLQDNLHMRI